MLKSVKLFNVFIFLIILYESKAIMSDCIQTVDIGVLKSVDDYFMHGKLQVPVNGTEQFSCTNPRGVNHTRSCFCKGSNCVLYCCSTKTFAPTEECSIIALILMNAIKNVTVEDNIKVRDYSCAEPKSNWHTLAQNNTLDIKLHQWSRMGRNENIYNFKLILCQNLMPGVRELGVISCVCYVLTIAVYLYLRRLRNLHGKCFISCFICMFMKCLFWFSNLNSSVAGYMSYFFWTASFLWFSAMNHVFYKAFDHCNPMGPGFRFYCLFVWLTAAIWTVVICLVGYFLENDATYIFPYSIESNAVNYPYTVVFYYGLMLILGLLNTFISVLNVKTILRNGRVIYKFSPVLPLGRGMFWPRILTLLGVTWSLDLILCIMQTYDFVPQLLWLADYIHASFGISIFLLFIVKRNTIQWLKEGNPIEEISPTPQA
ncbi:probable G-protein coupled receptor Mth-like 6 [Drosophila mauritiana]|uniref:Probable G-protein coupled receptor Mth-like 6 n=1 Tax=Drosophila mauritiana TaxID=7226 RepID=A0A6P8K3F4_DROMA|nr:probable G-protein coupled receptor Mth-like 6 [Drosophila mauritiana]